MDKKTANGQHGYFLAFLTVGFLWGLNWPAVKFVLTEVPPLTMRAVSFTSAAIILAFMVWRSKQFFRLQRDEIIPTAIVGAFLIFGFNVLTALGQMIVEASKATIFAYTMPSITAILAAFYLKERIRPKTIWALLIAMTGLAIMVSEDIASITQNPMGPIVMVLAALSWSIGNVGLKSVQWRLQPLPLTVWFFVFSSLIAWPLVFIYEPLEAQHWPSLNVVATLGFHVLGPMVTCYLLWSFLVSKLPTTIASISILIAPVVGVLSSIIFLDEVLSWQIIYALTTIIISIALVLTSKNE